MSIDEWNELDKPVECEEYAEEGDIIEIINNVIFLCQRTNNCNNIICFLQDPTDCNITHIKDMFRFCIILWEKYGIEYVRVEGNSRRYKFLEKIFPPEIVIRDPNILDRNVYYCNINKANKKLKELVND